MRFSITMAPRHFCRDLLPGRHRASDEARDHGGQFGRLDWLGDVHLETGSQSARPVFGSSKGRKRHRRDINAALSLPLTHSPHQAVAIFTRHSYVSHHYIGQHLWWSCSNQRVGIRGGTDSDHVCAVLSKRRLNQFARIILVINYQRAHASEFARSFNCNRLASVLVECRGDGADRKRDFESRALAFARARGLDRSAMQLDQVFDKSQTEAEAAVPSGARRVGLLEAVKDVGQEISADALRSRRASMRPPCGVNFTALESRFQITCCNRAGSPVI
jgi:hypothetical protein